MNISTWWYPWMYASSSKANCSWPMGIYLPHHQHTCSGKEATVARYSYMMLYSHFFWPCREPAKATPQEWRWSQQPPATQSKWMLCIWFLAVYSSAEEWLREFWSTIKLSQKKTHYLFSVPSWRLLWIDWVFAGAERLENNDLFTAKDRRMPYLNIHRSYKRRVDTWFQSGHRTADRQRLPSGNLGSNPTRLDNATTRWIIDPSQWFGVTFALSHHSNAPVRHSSAPGWCSGTLVFFKYHGLSHSFASREFFSVTVMVTKIKHPIMHEFDESLCKQRAHTISSPPELVKMT